MKKLMAITAALITFTGSAYAADWNFYGSARVATYVEDVDKIGGTGTSDTRNFTEALQGNARIGANIKASDQLTGRFEYGASGGNANIRILWGEWNFGAGSLGVGQHYSPLVFFYSTQAYGDDSGLLGYGGVYSGREAMLRLKFGNFQIAAVQPNTGFTDSTPGTSASTEVRIPAIEAKYKYSANNWHVQAAAGYNAFEVLYGGGSYDVDAYVVALGAGVDVGPFSLKGNIYTGENAGNLIWVGTGGATTADFNGTNLDETENFGYVLAVSYKLNDMVTFEAGYSHAEVEFESVSQEDRVTAYILQANITLAPGVYIVPEIGVIDEEEAGQNEKTYYGAKWQFNF